jgi:hypothetical protein
MTDALVTIYVAADITEADEVQGVLAEAGISSTLEPAESAEPAPVGDGRCRVLVAGHMREAAMDALAADEVGDEFDAW